MTKAKELPYEFDLYFDVKTRGELKRLVKKLRDDLKRIPKDLALIEELCAENGISMVKTSRG